MRAALAALPLPLPLLLLLAAGAVRLSPPHLFGEDPPHPTVLIPNSGYPVEAHDIETEDGYILTTFRIPRPRSSNRTRAPREPFILQHGLGMSAANWIQFGPEKSIAYYLVDHGFDVWITNVRGAKYSRKHKFFPPDSFKFWDFGWHEHGTLDMPAILDYVRNATGYERVWYAGHSMGTTMMFVMLSQRPEYNARVHHFFALAPIAYMGRMRSACYSLANTREKRKPFKMLDDVFGINRFPFDGGAFLTTRRLLCSVVPELCKLTLDEIVGRDREQEFKGSYDIIMKYFPMDMSIKQLRHYGQMTNIPNRFSLFDYEDESKNQAVYGSKIPPPYNMSKVTVPMTWIYAINDYFGGPEDVEEFSALFYHNSPKMHKIPLESFQHTDFLFARDLILYVGEPVAKYAMDFRQRFEFAAKRKIWDVSRWIYPRTLTK